MHSIELIKVRFKNLLSYGSNVNEVLLNNDGITWIKGSNGSGKSTVIEAITVALFGESYRKIPQRELINSVNQSKLWVWIEFLRTDANGTKKYTIERTLNKTGSMSFSIYVDDVIKEKEAGYSQKYLEDEILGFNRNIFENVISCNTIQSKPFIDMTSIEKRTLLESMIAMQIDKIKKANAADMALAKSKFDDATRDVVKFEKNIVELYKVRELLLLEQKTDIEQLKNDILLAENAINNYDIKISELKSEDIKVMAKGTQLKQDIDKYNNLNQLQLDINLYTVINDALIKSDDEIRIKKQLVDSSYTEYHTANEELSLLKEKAAQYSDVDSNINKYTIELNKYTYELEHINKRLDELKHEADELKSGVECSLCGKKSTDDDVHIMKESLRTLWKEHNKTKKNITTSLAVTQEKLTELMEHKKYVDDLDIPAKTKQVTTLNIQYANYNWSYEQLLNMTNSNREKIKELNERYSNKTLNEIRDQYTNDKSQYDSLSTQINDLRVQISNVRMQITNLSKLKEDALKTKNQLTERLLKKEAMNESGSLKINESQLNEANQLLKDANQNVKKYSDEIEIIKFLDTMYGDDGIKKYILGIFVPNLNQTIAKNISLFNLPFAIEFDDSLDYKFIGKYGLSQTYKGLSQGQQRKLNFCISMAFRDFVSLIADFKINIMFLDEVLDISTDDEGLRDMIGLIKDKNADIESIYLMSHRGSDYTEYWSHELQATNDGLFSQINQLY